MADFEKVIEIIKNGLAGPQAITAQAFIFDIQKENFQLQTRIRELEQEKLRLYKHIQDAQDWEKEKALYEIHHYSDKTLAYKKIGTNEFFCAHCFNSKKTPIHLQQIDRPHDWLFCPGCKNQYRPW